MHANKQNQIPELGAGDIGAVVGFKDINYFKAIDGRKMNVEKLNSWGWYAEFCLRSFFNFYIY